MRLRQVSKIRFCGLRNSLGCGGGVIFDTDEKLTYLCRVVRVENGLKWQIIKNKHQFGSDLVDYDQESLDECEITDVEVIKEPMRKYSLIGQRGKAVSKTKLSDIPF